MQYISQVIDALVKSEAHKATKFIDSKNVVRATRRRYRRKGVPRFSRRNLEVVLTVGRPNYTDRQFIKKCQTAGEPFPVKKIQLKFPAKKRA